MKNIPCVITTYDADGCRTLIATTMTYWGAKRLARKLTKMKPERVFSINEVWNSPMLLSVSRRNSSGG